MIIFWYILFFAILFTIFTPSKEENIRGWFGPDEFDRMKESMSDKEWKQFVSKWEDPFKK